MSLPVTLVQQIAAVREEAAQAAAYAKACAPIPAVARFAVQRAEALAAAVATLELVAGIAEDPSSGATHLLPRGEKEGPPPGLPHEGGGEEVRA